jgi:S-adenosylmethionine/arginine decarboxylase-like enzyme
MHGSIAGWHLIYDAQVEAEHTPRLADPAFLETAFRDLVKLLDMEILVEPAFRAVDPDPSKLETEHDEGGVTGVCVITTSHISIHTWPLRGKFSMDVYSCKKFEESMVQAFLKDRFGVVRRSSHWVMRIWP